MKLTKEAQARAREYIFEWGRPLEQARYAFHFEGKTADPVLHELAKFQNDDGGFGHGLEPDMRMPQSSALATTVALSFLHEVDAGSDEPLVQGAMGYLMDSYETDTKVWPIIPSHNNDFPHAPWWHDDGNLRRNFGQFLANPRADIVGYLFTYADCVPDGFPEEMATAIITHMDSYGDKVDMHDLACYVGTAEKPTLPASIRSQLLPKLRHSLLSTVETDPAKWGGYTPKPLAYIHSPQSHFADLMPEAVSANLDDVIERQQADGSWTPPWSWGDAYPDVWEQAKKEWAGVLTFSTLRQLQAFGRSAE